MNILRVPASNTKLAWLNFPPINATGVAQEVLRRGGGEHNDEVRSRRRLRCALMGLHLPVDVIAQGIMQGTL